LKQTDDLTLLVVRRSE